MEKLLDKMKGKGYRNQIENIVIFIVLLVIVIIVINSLFQNDKDTETNTVVKEIVKQDNQENDWERKLENILTNISGVGEVKVMISYANSTTQIPLWNTKENKVITEEQDVNGGKRKTEEVSHEQSIIFEEKNNTKLPAIQQTIMPEVIGVIVVAEGANHAAIKENIKNAVAAVVNVASHRIQVFAK